MNQHKNLFVSYESNIISLFLLQLQIVTFTIVIFHDDNLDKDNSDDNIDD